MDLDRKVTIAKRALDSIFDHDDAPLEEVKARFETIAGYATQRMAAAALRRASPKVLTQVLCPAEPGDDTATLKGCPLGH